MEVVYIEIVRSYVSVNFSLKEKGKYWVFVVLCFCKEYLE